MARKIHIPTKEEIEKDKPIILEGLHNGIPMSEMAELYNFSLSYVERIRDELIAEKIITMEEIKRLQAVYIQRKREAKKENKRKKHETKINHNKEERNEKEANIENKTLSLVKEKKPLIDIAFYMQTSSSKIRRVIDKLYKDGIITLEELNSIPSDRGHVSKYREIPGYIENRDKVVQYLELGWESKSISKYLGITPFYMELYLRDIKTLKLLTSKQIKDARAAKRKKDLDELESLVKNERPLKEFLETHPEISSSQFFSLCTELVATGKATREQIESNRVKAYTKTINRAKAMTSEEQTEFVTNLTKEGIGNNEILKRDKSGSLTLNRIKYIKKQLFEKGVFSKEEVRNAIVERNVKNKIGRIIELTKLGFSFKEIGLIMNYNSDYIYELKTVAEKKGLWFTYAELQEFKANRKDSSLDELPIEIKNKIIELRKQEVNREQEVKDIILQIKMYTEQGLVPDEIGKKMFFGLSSIRGYINKAKSMNMWYSDNEIEKFKVQRKRKEELERKQLEEANKAKVKKYSVDYINAKTNAKVESSSEQRGNFEFTCSRQKFIDVLISMFNDNIIIPNEDLLFLKEEMNNNATLAFPKNIRFLIVASSQNGGLETANKMASDLTLFLATSTYGEAVYKFRQWIRNQMYVQEMKRLANKGLNNKQIAKELKISDKALLDLSINAYKEVDFFGDGALTEFELEVLRGMNKDAIPFVGQRTSVTPSVRAERVKNIKSEIERLMDRSKQNEEITEMDIARVMSALGRYKEIASASIIKFLVNSSFNIGGLNQVENIILELTDLLESTRYEDVLKQYLESISKMKSNVNKNAFNSITLDDNDDDGNR